MALSSTSHSASDADIVSSTAGSIRSWVSTDITNAGTHSYDIKYVFGITQTSTYNDNQDFDAWIDGVNVYSGTVLNNKGSGSYKYYEEIVNYPRPVYGQPAENYTARAQVTGIFDGPTANTGTQNTDHDTPARAGTYPPPATGMYVSALTSSTITWNWTPPNMLGIGPAVTSYNMQIFTDPSLVNLVYNANIGNVTSFQATGLAKATSYWARVQPVNSVSGGTWNSLVGATTSATVPDTMAAPTVSAATTSGFTVAFVAPGNGGSAITSYEIQLSTDNFSTVHSTITGVTSTPRVITGLSPGVKYKARVRAVNAIGGASWSASSAEIQTLGGVKVWNGSAWIEGIVRSWNGSAWVVVVVRKWNGSSWIV